jgi:hypothetical protein
MEESGWEEFAKTGKVTDYLKYRVAKKQKAIEKHLTKPMTCEMAAEFNTANPASQKRGMYE